MTVENLSAAPMDLMYLCHANFAFAEGARIVQPAYVRSGARRDPDGHSGASLTPTDDYRAFVKELATRPDRMEVLNEPERYAPEQVFYIKKVEARCCDALIHFMLGGGARAMDSRSPTTPSPCPTQSAGSSTAGISASPPSPYPALASRRLYGREEKGPCPLARKRSSRDVHHAPRLRRSTPRGRSRPLDHAVCRRGLT